MPSTHQTYESPAAFAEDSDLDTDELLTEFLSSHDDGQPDDELVIGIELEYPRSKVGETTMKHAGRQTIHEDWRDRSISDLGYGNGRGERLSDIGGEITYDSTVGAEFISSKLTPSGGDQWYRDILDYAKHDWGVPFEPTGSLSNGPSAGLHIHMSPISQDQAESLYNLSQKPWMRIFAGTSLAEDIGHYNPFRDSSYCRFGGFAAGNNGAVRSRNISEGHWEWRLPEPMTAEHFRLLMEFLDRWYDDPGRAKEWARARVFGEDDRITSFRRAYEIGPDTFIPDSVETESGLEPLRVARAPHPESVQFFQNVRDNESAPYIYRVVLADGGDKEHYYAFQTHTLSGTQEITQVDSSEGPIEIRPESILHAEDLDYITDSSNSAAATAVREALESPLDVQTGNSPARRAEATDLIGEIIA